MQYGNDQRRGIWAGQAEDEVMFAAGCSQAVVDIVERPKVALTCGKAHHAPFERSDILACLNVTPSTAGVANDRSQVRFRSFRKDELPIQGYQPDANSSFRISPTLLSETAPPSPSLMRCCSNPLNSCHA